MFAKTRNPLIQLALMFLIAFACVAAAFMALAIAYPPLIDATILHPRGAAYFVVVCTLIVMWAMVLFTWAKSALEREGRTPTPA